MFTHFKMTWMPKFPAAFLARKPALIVVDKHVIVKAMLTSKGGVADKANKRLDS